jgi:D-alanyl-D-alanine carboxypeptidase/D-alanyl-D-alanine-endopeptidase (penicillin-binding protein 4)
MKAVAAWAVALALTSAMPASAQPPSLQARVEAKLAEAGQGTRFGLVVTAEDGRELVAIAPEGRFVPASTTKMFTIAAVFAGLGGLDAPDAAGGATVSLQAPGAAVRAVVLAGHGDARLSSAADCREDCLAALADAVAAQARTVGDVVGDDSAFADERWSPGMSWNNIPTASGTAASALTLDDDELPLLVTPAAPGQPPRAEMPAYYFLRNEARTVAAGEPSALDVERLPGSRTLRLTGTIAAGARPQRLRLGIDDPADYAATRFAALLAARGVRVTGRVLARHRGDPGAGGVGTLVARLTPPPLVRDLRDTAKASQNLHAELFLRRLGGVSGNGSIADGLAQVRMMLDRAGVPRHAAEFSDGSGMSTYNRVSPRGVVAFLRWAAAQPWRGVSAAARSRAASSPRPAPSTRSRPSPGTSSRRAAAPSPSPSTPTTSLKAPARRRRWTRRSR